MAETPKSAKETPDKKTAVEPAAEAATDVAAAAPHTRKKNRRQVPHGQVHVLATFNNTLVTVTDPKGAVLTQASAGSTGFRGSKKGTAYAAQVAAEKALADAKQLHGLSKVDVLVKGVGLGREAAIRTLINQRLQIEIIRDLTSLPHGGTRPRKARRT